MKPIDFLFADGRLTAPQGQADKVQDLPYTRAAGYIVTAWELDPEERREVHESGVLWLCFHDVAGPNKPPFFPPVLPQVGHPRLQDLEVYVAGAANGQTAVLQYLDLNLLALTVEPDEAGWVVREVIPHFEGNPEPERVKWHDVEFRKVKTLEDGTTDTGPLQGGKYLFKDPVKPLGRLRDLPFFSWIHEFIFPAISPDVLLLAPLSGPRSKTLARLLETL